MKHRFTRFAFVALFTTVLMACINDSKDKSGEQPDLRITIVDSASGLPLGVETVTWSYYGDAGAHLHKAAHGSDSTHKSATRANAEGTAWEISHHGLHGSVFLRAYYSKFVDVFCTDGGYVIREINADSLPQQIELQMAVTRECE